MTTSPLITIYITNYNYGKFIKKAIDSVLNQTYKNIEIIIIDDGSTDDSKKVINEYEKHPLISVIYQNNKGLTISNNIAISVARGQFIIRLDADDYLDENALKLLFSEFEKDTELGMVFGDWYEIDEYDNVTAIERRHNFEKDVSLFDQPAHGACTMFRLSYLKELQGYDESLSRQDGYELWFRFIKKYKIKSINIPVFYYRKHGNNLTSNEEKLLNTRAQILEKHGHGKDGKSNILSIVPIRGSDIDQRSQPFVKIGNKFLLDFTLEELLKVSKIKHILITTPDKEVIDYVQNKYNTEKIICQYRDPQLARINSNIASTIMHALIQYEDLEQIDAFFVSTIESPFKRKELLESAINIKKIFDVDTVIGVISKKDMLFKHTGDGLVAVNTNQSLLRLEREQLYNYITGYTLCDLRQFLATNQLFTGKIGHISVDQKSAFIIRTKLDLEIAEFLCNR